jgi:hypothetical protein
MESLTLCEVNNAIAKSVSVNAVAATKIAGIRISKSSRGFHTTPMTTVVLRLQRSLPSHLSKLKLTLLKLQVLLRMQLPRVKLMLKVGLRNITLHMKVMALSLLVQLKKLKNFLLKLKNT